MSLRKSASWMEQIDERILEFTRANGWASPSLLANEDSIEASEGRIAERCQRLWYAGFIEPIHGEMYDITTWGQLYLEGEVDAEHFPTPTVERALE